MGGSLDATAPIEVAAPAGRPVGFPEVCRIGDLGEQGDRAVMMIVRRVVASALAHLRSGCQLAVAVWPALGVQGCRAARLAPRGWCCVESTPRPRLSWGC